MKRNYKIAIGALALSGLLSTIGLAQEASNRAADNTSANKQEQRASQSTADQARNDKSDREVSRNIRRDVVKDKSLSTYGHNVKIVANGGKVTLRGPVRSEDEKRAIEAHARKYAGEGNVANELTVKSEQTH